LAADRAVPGRAPLRLGRVLQPVERLAHAGPQLLGVPVGPADERADQADEQVAGPGEVADLGHPGAVALGLEPVAPADAGLAGAEGELAAPVGHLDDVGRDPAQPPPPVEPEEAGADHRLAPAAHPAAGVALGAPL